MRPPRLLPAGCGEGFACWAFCSGAVRSTGLAFFSCGWVLFSSCFAGFSGSAFFSFGAGLAFSSSCWSCCSCCAYAGAATPRVRDKTAALITPISFIVVASMSSMVRTRLALAQASCGCVGRAADSFPGNHQLNPAVLLPPGGIIVGRYRKGVTEAFGRNRIPQNPFLHKIIPDRSGAILGKRLIHGIATDIIGVAADFNVQSWVSEQDASDLGEFLPCARLQGILSGVEQNIRHADDKSARAVACLENRIQLFRQLGAHRRLVSIRLLCALLSLLRS